MLFDFLVALRKKCSHSVRFVLVELLIVAEMSYVVFLLYFDTLFYAIVYCTILYFISVPPKLSYSNLQEPLSPVSPSPVGMLKRTLMFGTKWPNFLHYPGACNLELFVNFLLRVLP